MSNDDDRAPRDDGDDAPAIVRWYRARTDGLECRHIMIGVFVAAAVYVAAAIAASCTH